MPTAIAKKQLRNSWLMMFPFQTKRTAISSLQIPLFDKVIQMNHLDATMIY